WILSRRLLWPRRRLRHRRRTRTCPGCSADRLAGTRRLLALCGVARKYGAEPMTFTLNALMLQPIVALLAGMLILIVPRILNFIIAIYLIFVGVTGLWPHLMSGVPH